MTKRIKCIRDFLRMRYINVHFTYLLTGELTLTTNSGKV